MCCIPGGGRGGNPGGGPIGWPGASNGGLLSPSTQKGMNKRRISQ